MKGIRSTLQCALFAATLSIGPAGAADLAIETYTASAAGLLVNSHLVKGEREAILVDAQFTRSEAGRLVEQVRASGRRLKTIFVTHAHPDHYLGLEVLQKAFPDARIVTTPEVIADIVATAPAKIEYWKAVYKDDLADAFVRPVPVTPDDLRLEGIPLEMIPVDHGESEHAVALYVPTLGALVSGDLVYGDVHLWLAEGRADGWLRNLSSVGRRDIRRVLSGHGVSGGPELLDANREYIEAFVHATESGETREAAVAAMAARYPGYALPVVLDLSVGAATGQ